MENVIKDVSMITSIPEDKLNRLIDIGSWCIGHFVHEQQLQHQDTIEIDIGIGSLIISNELDVIKYKFIPNSLFEEMLIDVIVENKNPLKKRLEKRLADKILKPYKELL